MPSNRRCGGAGPPSLQSAKTRWVRGLLCATAIAVTFGAANPGQVPGQQPPSLNPDRPYLMPEANRLPDVNDQMRMREKKAKQQNFDAINLQRRKQIAEDSEKLITLAIALKAEVDGSTDKKPTANEVRKAEGIEKLAHEVKQTMELTVNPN
jgi:hypothetical protein